jgi:D-alanyl-D-alanine carboxypeptidase
MWRGRRHVVAVVLGGRSAGQRDARMRELLADNIALASTTRTATVFARGVPAADAEQVAEERAAAPTRSVVLHKPAPAVTMASIEAEPVATAFHAAPVPGSTDPIRPRLVKTVSIKPVSKASKAATVKFAALPAPVPHHEGAAPAKVADGTHDSAARAHKPERAQSEKSLRGGWMIQVGAFGAEQEARARLSAAQSRAKRLLGEADPFTEPVTKGEKTIYRARFAGLDKHQAEAACRTLKRNEIACLTLRN